MGGDDGFVALGKIVRPQGIRGEVRIFLLTERPDVIESADSLWLQRADEAPDEREVQRVRFIEKHAIVKFSGIDDRDGAEALKGAFLMLPDDELPALPAGSHHVFDLVGLEVRTTKGEVVGPIIDVMQMPAHDVLVVEHDGRECMIPAVDAFVRRVAVDEGFVEINVIEGLLD